MVLVGTNHVLTLAASKQENEAVENANKLWKIDVLPLVQRIMMAYPNDVIGVSPA